jgi:predicted permease
MRFDLSDPARVTRRTDIAFWLHLLAAPLIVHPLISQFTAHDALPQVWAAVAVLALFVPLGIVAVVIDRRAMLVSGLAYAGYALSSLISTIGLADRTLPATLLALGAFVLLLSAGWRSVRTALLRLLPAHLAHRLPHPILSS